jgi:hypothetical protein
VPVRKANLLWSDEANDFVWIYQYLLCDCGHDEGEHANFEPYPCCEGECPCSSFSVLYDEEEAAALCTRPGCGHDEGTHAHNKPFSCMAGAELVGCPCPGYASPVLSPEMMEKISARLKNFGYVEVKK